MQLDQLKALSVLRLTLITVAAAGAILAADKPNFSGSWKMDSTKSDFGGAPPPDSFSRKIEHNEPAVILTDDQTSALGTEKVVRRYTTDRKETTYQWMGSEVKSAAHWEDNSLVIIGNVNAGGTDVVVTSTLTISADGKTLTESGKVVAAGNEVGAFKLVLVKQ
jgi:hypothetical protein